MNYKILESGSKGNATITEDIILIDCGVPFERLKEYYKDLKLVLLTHIHSDHFNKTTIKKLAYERPTLRFGCCEWLVQDLIDCGVNKRLIDVYDFCTKISYVPLEVDIDIFKLDHDVPNCGYLITIDDKKYFYATDTSNLDNVSATDCSMYFIEANYEDKTELDRRIKKHIEKGETYYEDRVENTHLSKVKAIDWLMKNMSEKSQYIFLHKHIEKNEKGD